MLKVGSLFSGIGGLDLGMERAGMQVLWQCEIDKDARRVLRRRWPGVALYGDVKEIHAPGACERRAADDRLGLVWGQPGECPSCVPAVDLLVGGFPCQDLSVAGARAGLAGDRSGLFFEFMRLAAELAPRWVLIENVPGLLSSNNGADMGVVLDTLAELGYGWAYRVLDAQYFGVAQRRRRVFIVGCLGDARRAAQVLFEPESCGGGPPARPAPGPGTPRDVANSLGGVGGGQDFAVGKGDLIIEYADPSAPSPPVCAKWAKGTGGPAGDEAQNLVTYSVVPETGGGADLVVKEFEVSQTLSADVLSRGAERQPLISFRKAQRAHDADDCERWEEADVADTLVEMGATSGIAVCFSVKDDGRDVTEELAPTLRAMGHDGSHANGGGQLGVLDPSALLGVRRLMPLECERLQGFPDDWTAEEGDSVRYKTLGNAVCVAVSEWIGKRIAEVEAHGC